MSTTASDETLVTQAATIAEGYLSAAVSAIDKHCMKGYALAHPELVAAFMQVCTSDFNNAVIVKAIQEATTELANAFAKRT